MFQIVLTPDVGCFPEMLHCWPSIRQSTFRKPHFPWPTLVRLPTGGERARHLVTAPKEWIIKSKCSVSFATVWLIVTRASLVQERGQNLKCQKLPLNRAKRVTWPKGQENPATIKLSSPMVSVELWHSTRSTCPLMPQKSQLLSSSSCSPRS